MENDKIEKVVAELQKTQQDRHEAAVEVFHELQHDLAEAQKALSKAQKDVRWLHSSSALLWVVVVLMAIF